MHFFLLADDPYYSGLRARIPNFVKSRKKKQQEKEAKERDVRRWRPLIPDPRAFIQPPCSNFSPDSIQTLVWGPTIHSGGILDFTTKVEWAVRIEYH